MSQALPTGAPADAPAPANVAGEALRSAREAAGLSIDIVAQHLKLAPRQVRALEDGDYAHLPGRTFVRGFARNYARLLSLDADAVVAALPDAASVPSLDRPALGTTARGVGEIDEHPRRRSRALVPLLIVALLALAALYDLNRPDSLLRSLLPRDASVSTPSRPAPQASGTVTQLRNPLVDKDAAATSEMPPRDAPPPIVADAATVAAAPVASATSPAPSAVAPAGHATLVIEYRGPSWTEVRDGTGQRLLIGTMRAGSQETVTGAPPFEVTLGNVQNTSVTWRGATVDTSAWHKQNVARLRLE